ncbi:DsbA family oxidoreductase [Rhodoplanes sp. TEM]|uniref:DsbA family oxidoreductase n=1 Tax=Rhodoplanes tepidamans TaxID=200616 RepID=A0ABT5JHP1_RHOTP|nr:MULTISPECIES: DsbA family oxidoreductase [Rhodoplanes]MDC7789240.1 DsbA family oxidoreductase [Rhodoplanes tepidamans]MDC7985822.1 DsbA family oxidoreductase [Rhodoplanes sp. TEM]MDQ0358851.1 putative DsbA family dithiol-disulfide isomerase [Rhodoplanes tepidamans]
MTDAPVLTKMPIDVVSDVVCPWCFIGKRRLERALAATADIPVTVRWRAYFLNPWVPREGIGRRDYLERKFGSVERYMANAPRMVAAAEAEGLVYAIDRIERQPNTIDCHRLIKWAGEADPATASAMKQRLMELYFTEAQDLSQRAVLLRAAADVGLDPHATGERLATTEDEDVVTAEAEAAQRAGVDGVPCFVFGGVLAVSGAQSPDYLAGAIRRANETFQQKLAAGEIADPEKRPY